MGRCCVCLNARGGRADTAAVEHRSRTKRPDWHMRRPFLVAFLLTGAALSLAEWWAGPALLAGLIAYYLLVRYTPFG
jgi:hypothetical protein